MGGNNSSHVSMDEEHVTFVKGIRLTDKVIHRMREDRRAAQNIDRPRTSTESTAPTTAQAPTAERLVPLLVQPVKLTPPPPVTFVSAPPPVKCEAPDFESPPPPKEPLVLATSPSEPKVIATPPAAPVETKVLPQVAEPIEPTPVVQKEGLSNHLPPSVEAVLPHPPGVQASVLSSGNTPLAPPTSVSLPVKLTVVPSVAEAPVVEPVCLSTPSPAGPVAVPPPVKAVVVPPPSEPVMVPPPSEPVEVPPPSEPVMVPPPSEPVLVPPPSELVVVPPPSELVVVPPPSEPVVVPPPSEPVMVPPPSEPVVLPPPAEALMEPPSVDVDLPTPSAAEPLIVCGPTTAPCAAKPVPPPSPGPVVAPSLEPHVEELQAAPCQSLELATQATPSAASEPADPPPRAPPPPPDSEEPTVSAPPPPSIEEAAHSDVALDTPLTRPAKPLAALDEETLRRQIQAELTKDLEEEMKLRRQELQKQVDEVKAAARAQAQAIVQAQIKEEVQKVLALEKAAQNDKMLPAVAEECMTTETEKLMAQLYWIELKAHKLDEKEKQLKKQDTLYREQLAKIEEKQAPFFRVTTESFRKGQEDVHNTFKRVDIKPVCGHLQSQILQCYRENTGQTLACSAIANLYMQCVESHKKTKSTGG